MNRRIRNRTYGGVGGRQGKPCLLPDFGIPVFPSVKAKASGKPGPWLGYACARTTPGFPALTEFPPF